MRKKIRPARNKYKAYDICVSMIYNKSLPWILKAVNLTCAIFASMRTDPKSISSKEYTQIVLAGVLVWIGSVFASVVHSVRNRIKTTFFVTSAVSFVWVCHVFIMLLQKLNLFKVQESVSELVFPLQMIMCHFFYFNWQHVKGNGSVANGKKFVVFVYLVSVFVFPMLLVCCVSVLEDMKIVLGSLFLPEMLGTVSGMLAYLIMQTGILYENAMQPRFE